MGDTLTCGSDAIPVLVRSCSLIALRLPMRFGQHQHTPHWWDEFQHPSSVE